VGGPCTLAGCIMGGGEFWGCKVRGLAAVRRCYAEGGGDCYISCSGGGNVVVA
jgi:hypothetical protein